MAFNTSFTDITGGLQALFGGSGTSHTVGDETRDLMSEIFGTTVEESTSDTDVTGKKTSYLDIDAAGVQRIMEQILGGTQGLASIFSEEQASGLYNTTAAKQASGDLLSQLAGEIAKLTAKQVEDVTESQTKTGTVTETKDETTSETGTISQDTMTTKEETGLLDGVDLPSDPGEAAEAIGDAASSDAADVGAIINPTIVPPSVAIADDVIDLITDTVTEPEDNVGKAGSIVNPALVSPVIGVAADAFLDTDLGEATVDAGKGLIGGVGDAIGGAVDWITGGSGSTAAEEVVAIDPQTLAPEYKDAIPNTTSVIGTKGSKTAVTEPEEPDYSWIMPVKTGWGYM